MAVCGKLIFTTFHLCSYPGAPPLGLPLASSPLRSQRCPEPGSLEPNWPHRGIGGPRNCQAWGHAVSSAPRSAQPWGLGPGPAWGPSRGNGLTQMPATDWKEESQCRVHPGWLPGGGRFAS